MKKENAKHYALALQGAARGKKKNEVDALVQSFVSLWGTRGKIKFLSAVLKELVVAGEQERGIEHVEYRMARVAEKEAKALITLLSKQLKKDVEVTVIEDPSLIAGAVVTYGDTRIDGSVRARIRQMAKLLNC